MANITSYYSFGFHVLNELPNKNKILNQLDFFKIGLYGPNFLENQKSSPTSISLAKKIHNASCKSFIVNNSKYLRKNNLNINAYMYGFIIHFALDSTLTPIVNHLEKDLKTQTFNPNVFVEEYLKSKDQDLLQNRNLYEIQSAKKSIEDEVRPLYETYGIKETELKQAFNNFWKFSNEFESPSKRNSIISKLYNFFFDKENKSLKDTTNNKIKSYERILRRKIDFASELALKLLKNYEAYLSKEKVLNDYFSYNFAGVKENSNFTSIIPIISF